MLRDMAYGTGHRSSGWRRCRGVLPLLAVAILPGTGCAPSAIEGGFESPHPASRIYAARRAASAADPVEARKAIPHLIDALESDDPALRLIASDALWKLTGETYGYRYFDPEPVRLDAVDRWVEAWSNGRVSVLGQLPASGTPSEPATSSEAQHASRNGSEAGR